MSNRIWATAKLYYAYHSRSLQVISLWSNTYINTKIQLFESLSDAYISRFLWRVKPPILSCGGSFCVDRRLFKRGRSTLFRVGEASIPIKWSLKLSIFSTSNPTPSTFISSCKCTFCTRIFFLMQYFRVVSVLLGSHLRVLVYLFAVN